MILCYIYLTLHKLPNILVELKKYGDISNVKVTVEKTEILNISVPFAESMDLRILYPFPFVWKQKGLKYMGIFLSTLGTDMF